MRVFGTYIKCMSLFYLESSQKRISCFLSSSSTYIIFARHLTSLVSLWSWVVSWVLRIIIECAFFFCVPNSVNTPMPKWKHTLLLYFFGVWAQWVAENWFDCSSILGAYTLQWPPMMPFDKIVFKICAGHLWWILRKQQPAAARNDAKRRQVLNTTTSHLSHRTSFLLVHFLIFPIIKTVSHTIF